MKPDADSPKFYLGLCMAGAVSAGAYTAGVMDYLLEALEEWEKRRGQTGVPSHRVEIPVVGGASAGGMTSVITAAALTQGITHFDTPTSGELLKDHPENILYHSWVDLTSEDMFTTMLGTGDIKPGEVYAAFNSDFIDQVANRVINPPAPKLPAMKKWYPVPKFFSGDLKVFTTLSNLQGFDYDVAFKSAVPGKRTPYYIDIHNDYACFELTNKKITGPNKGWMPLSIEHQVNTGVAIEAAMATGAFPIGLKSRLLTRDVPYVNHDPLMDKTILKDTQQTGASYQSLNVDGGMINNEPFDMVRKVLNDVSDEDDPKIYQNYNLFNSTVLMIAPFPSSEPTPISKSQRILNVIGLTLSAMISQMRSKPAHLVDAMDSHCGGQYLVAPSREFHKNGKLEETILGERAIACGALGGFSGFLNKKFRVHDYFLGRHNCKIFLRDYFTIPEAAMKKNPIFKNGYAGCTISQFKSHVDNSYQIIPVFPGVNYDFPQLGLDPKDDNWPVLQPEDITRFKSDLKERIEAILLNIEKLTSWRKFWLWVGSRILLRKVLANSIIETIQSALKRWKLLKN